MEMPSGAQRSARHEEVNAADLTPSSIKLWSIMIGEQQSKYLFSTSTCCKVAKLGAFILISIDTKNFTRTFAFIKGTMFKQIPSTSFTQWQKRMNDTLFLFVLGLFEVFR